MKISLNHAFTLGFFLTIFTLANAYYGDITHSTQWMMDVGTCGIRKSETNNRYYYAALSTERMKLPKSITNHNKHPLCGSNRCIRVDGKRASVVLKISDTCSSCGYNDIDVPFMVFGLLGDTTKKRFKVDWEFSDCSQLGKI